MTPIREVDGRKIGAGHRGPVTKKLQKAFFQVVNGKDPRHAGWLAPVAEGKGKAPAGKGKAAKGKSASAAAKTKSAAAKRTTKGKR